MFSNTRLGKVFWVEAVVYASHLINQLPSTTIGDKNPMEVQYGKLANDCFKFFCSTTSYHVKQSKLKPRAKKAMFMGITSDIKEYQL